jgi:hypothetical protein
MRDLMVSCFLGIDPGLGFRGQDLPEWGELCGKNCQSRRLLLLLGPLWL